MIEHGENWMSPRHRWLAALALMFGLATAIACGGGNKHQELPSQFAGYPSSEALSRVVETHIEAGTDTRYERALLTTWFLDGDPRVARFMSVTPAGKCSKYQYVHAAEYSGPPLPTQLSPRQMSTILDAVQHLPPGGKPPLENMVIVSFRKNGVWETRLYDRTNRPPALSTIYETANAPIVP